MRPSLLALAAALVAAAPTALADRLVLSDGRVVEGAVTKEGSDYRIVSRFGESVLPEKQVTEWVKARPFDEEWRERLAALPEGDLDARASLAKWLAESGRASEAEATAGLVLESDPEHAAAHAVLGHVRFRGKWMSQEAANLEQGLVRKGDTWYTPAEWALLDPDGKKKAEEAETVAAQKRRAEAVNEAMRLMLAKDANLRVEGERRLQEIAKESGSKEIAALVPQVQAYAAANDRMVSALASQPGESRGRVLAETRIQLATLKRPIRQLATSLASGPTGVPVSTNAPVIIQLPELEVITLKTTTVIPTD